MNKKLKMFIAGLLTTTAIVSLTSNLTMASIFGGNNEIKISVMSDLHMFPEEFAGEQGPNFKEYLAGDRKMLVESERIIDAAIEKILAEDPDVVLIPGDLTKDSERLSHEMLVEKLKEIEDKGIEVFVINGNHDINNPSAIKFIPDPNDENNDIKVPVETIKQNDFRKMYDEFGYGQAIAKHDTSVSYVAQLKPGYRIIAIDTGTYGEDASEQATEGYFREGLVEWVLEQIEEAKKAGDEVIGMMHHGLVEHFDGQSTIFSPYVVKGWEEASTKFADAGMKYAFTGHFHAQDIVGKKTDKGNYILDIMTGSLVTAPSPIRTVEINKKLNRFNVTSAKIESIEGVEDFQTYANEFLEAGIPDMVVGLLQDILLGMFPEDTYTLEDIANKIESDSTDFNIAKLIDNSIGKDRTEGTEILENGKALITNKQIRDFIIGVTNQLRTEVITGETKFMDVVQYCLVEVYSGDEEITEEMKFILDEIKKEETVVNFFTKIIIDNKNKLGLAGLVINENLVKGLFSTEISEGTTAGSVITNALSGLMESLLYDTQPGDNNVRLYNGEVLTSTPVIDAINSIPKDVTLADKDRVEATRFIYNDLSTEEKDKITNLDILIKAEASIIKLEKDKEAIDKVESIIANLPDVITIEHENLVKSARNVYNLLTEEQKKGVTNYEKLLSAEKTIANLLNNNTTENNPEENKPENNKPENNNSGNNNSGNNENNKPNSKLPNTGAVVGLGALGFAGVISTIAGIFMTKKKKIK